MGWKAFNLFASSRGDGYLGSFPTPQPEKGKNFVSLLGCSYTSDGGATLEDALYPKSKGELYVGAYEHALVLGSIPLAEEAFLGHVPDAVIHACRLFPNSPVLVAMLHSVVNLFGYAWFENGRLLRARAGSADDGMFLDQGEPMAFELPLFEDSEIRDGTRVYIRKIRGEVHEFDESAFGEEFVMEACRPFLGCRLDQYNAWDLAMERFVRS